MKTTNFEDLGSKQTVAKPKSTFSNRLADGAAIFIVFVGAVLMIPLLGFLIIGFLGAMTVTAAATVMLSISLPAVFAIEAAFVAGACLFTLGGWIAAIFGTPDIENASTLKQEEVIVASNVVLPRLSTQEQVTSELGAGAQKATRFDDASKNSSSPLLQFGHFSGKIAAHAQQTAHTPTEDVVQKSGV